MNRCDCSPYDPDKCEILALPDTVDKGRQSGTICVDKCIASVLNLLWIERIDTCGCCCGHGKDKPSIVIREGVDLFRTMEILCRIDDRDWEVRH